MPTKFLRINATWPLAVLAVNDGQLSLRLRGPIRRTGGVPLKAVPGDLTRVYPVQIMDEGRGIHRSRGP